MTLSSKAQGKRKLDQDSSDDSSDSDTQAQALASLKANGEAFLQSFPHIPKAFRRKRTEDRASPAPSESFVHQNAYKSWDGLCATSDEAQAVISNTKSWSPAPDNNIVVFSEMVYSSGSSFGPVPAMKSLMSSKVSKIHSDKKDRDGPQSPSMDAERSLVQNDKELYRLLHTKLLAGASDSAIHGTNGQRHRAMQGRLLELSGKARIGDGVKLVRHEYKMHQPKRQRDQMQSKEREVDKGRRREAEDNGMFHGDLKKSLFFNKQKHRPRIKGIGSGIGKYKEGTLTLSRADIATVTDSSNPRVQGGRSKRLKR